MYQEVLWIWGHADKYAMVLSLGAEGLPAAET